MSSFSVTQLEFVQFAGGQRATAWRVKADQERERLHVRPLP
jgi:hypothetical protein